MISETKTSCFHCGEDCEEERIDFDSKIFCCQGCKTVYSFLDQSNLTQFYKIEENAAGVSQKSTKKTQYDFLDDLSIREQILDFDKENLAKVHFYLPQIHCASCLWLLEKLPRIHEGVLQSQVNYLEKKVYITFANDKITLQELANLLASIGYAPSIHLDKINNKSAQKPKISRLYYQLGLTGFCFGNIMISSFPEYLGLDDWARNFQNVFRYLNLILSLPVLFYGARDYLLSAYRVLLHRGINADVPTSLGILALFFRSAWEILSQTGAGYMDSMVAFVFLLLVGKWFQEKTFEQISFDRDYGAYFPIAITVLRDGKQKSIPLPKLKIGDVIIIRQGEIIPADAILLEGDAQIDYSFVTGESKAVSVDKNTEVLAGGKQKGGLLKLKLKKEVSQSYLVQLWNQKAFSNPNDTSLDNITSRIAYYFTFAILAIALISATYWFYDSGINQAVNVLTSVLIVACPCALMLNVPFTLGNSLRVLAKKGLFVKNTQVIERLNNISHIVFDKTGTLTKSEGNKVSFHGGDLNFEEQEAVKALAQHSIHPVSRQIVDFLEGGTSVKVSSFEEFEGSGISAKINSKIYKLGKGSFVDFDVKNKNLEGKTVSFLKIDNQIKGYFEIEQTIKKGVPALLSKLKKIYKLALLSGDNPSEKETMSVLFGESKNLHFQQSPEQKMKFIEGLQSQKEKILMLGDGLNDAGALAQSNVGIAISQDVHNFVPACDAIMDAKSLNQLDKLLIFSKKSMTVVRIGFFISFLYNIVGLSIAIQAQLSPLIAAILMPSSSITVIVLGVLLTNFWSKRLFN
jgi:Cu+-exporting ATPase